MHWIDVALARQQAKMRRYAQAQIAAHTRAIQVSDVAPGWHMLDESYSAIPHALYPFDPAVLRAIRVFCPDVIPITITTTWIKPDDDIYTPMKLVRHGLARAVRNPVCPTHEFHCDMPASASRRAIPNYIEVNWYDKELRDFGHDLPGNYLPFDWDFYYAMEKSYTYNVGSADIVRKLCDPRFELQKRRKRQQAEEQAYRERDVEAYRKKKWSEVSEVELKEYFLSDPEPPPTRPSVVVPAPQGGSTP